MYTLKKIEKELTDDIQKVFRKYDVKSKIKIIKPNDLKKGDFSLPCFQLSDKFKKPPNKIAILLKNELKKNPNIKRIDVVNGYLNFYLDQKKITKLIFESLKNLNEKFGYYTEKNKKIIIEHTSANPNGPLHVGRARNPIIGDTIVRISKAIGYDVESQFYLDDMGKQVAILNWGLENLKTKDVKINKRNKPDHQKVAYYQKTVKLMKESIHISQQIQEIVKKSEKGDKKTLEDIKKTYKPVLKGINQSLNKLNIKIDKYIPESIFVKDRSVFKVVSKLNSQDFSKKEKNARYIDLKKFGISGRNTNFYYLREDGTTLYATRDIAYHLWKAKNADILINILGEDHKLESKQVEIALKILNEKNLPKVVFYSFVSLPEGKMSTRKARVVFLDDLIDECIERAYLEVKKRRGDELTEKEMKNISEIVGVGAIRYNIIKVQPEKAIVFKWEEALNFEGNSAPFIQYAHARASNILKKNDKKISPPNKIMLKDISEKNLVKKIAEFPEIIEKSFREFKPHLIANYLYEFSSMFNLFYRDCPVLSEKNKELKNTRLFLVKSSRIVIKNGLDLLGITAPEEM